MSGESGTAAAAGDLPFPRGPEGAGRTLRYLVCVGGGEESRETLGQRGVRLPPERREQRGAGQKGRDRLAAGAAREREQTGEAHQDREAAVQAA